MPLSLLGDVMPIIIILGNAFIGTLIWFTICKNMDKINERVDAQILKIKEFFTQED